MWGEGGGANIISGSESVVANIISESESGAGGRCDVFKLSKLTGKTKQAFKTDK